MKNLDSRGGGGDLLAYKQETGEREERVKRSNSWGRGGDISANTKKNSPRMSQQQKMNKADKKTT